MVMSFVSAALERAAYESCTKDDLRLGHLRAAEWLQAHGSLDAPTLAHHWQQAGHPRRAFALHMAAARMALAAHDGSQFEEHLERARQCKPSGDGLAQWVALYAAGAYWEANIAQARERLLEGLARLSPRDDSWWQLANLSITAHGQAGDNEAVTRLAALVLEASPGNPGALSPMRRDAWVAALSRAFTQLDAAGLAEAEPLYGALQGLDAAALGWEARACLARARASRSFPNFEATRQGWLEAHHAHLRSDDPRSAAQVALYLASLAIWSGSWERARDHIDDALGTAKRLGATYLVQWAEYTDAKLKAETAPYVVARQALQRTISTASHSPRFRAGAHLYWALAALRHGAPQDAIAQATQAQAVTTVPSIRAAAAAAHALALLDSGDAAAAMTHAAQWRLQSQRGERTVEFTELVWCAELAVSARDAPAGTLHERARSTLYAIESRAQTLEDPLRRNEYLARPYAVVRAQQLAHEILGESAREVPTEG
jgi:hypothetical protein